MRTLLRIAVGVLGVLAVQFSAAAQEGLREEVKKHEPRITRPPQLLKFVESPYPPGAAKRGVQGTVELLLEIGPDGKVRKVEVQKSPDPELSTAAVAAAQKFQFAPAEVDNKPAPVRVRYGYHFTIQSPFRAVEPEWAQDRTAVVRGADSLVGRVREQGTRVPIAGAVVILRSQGIEVRADQRGAFAIRELPPGRYRVEALSPDHKRDQVDIEVRRGEQTRIDFYLSRLAANPYETVVRGTRRKTTVTRVSLRERELTTVPGTFGDPIRVIENLPGVARVPYVGGALLVRGSPPQDSGIYIDGIQIPIVYHFLGGPSVLNPAFLDRIDYYPGNAEVKFGRLTAGLIDVGTRNTFTQQWGGAIDINLLNASAMVKIPISSKVSVAAALRRSYIDALLPEILKLSGRSATTVVPVYYDYQLRVDVKLQGDNRLFLLAFGSADSLAIATNEPTQKFDLSLDTQITFHRLLAGWRWQITPRLVSNMTPSFGFDDVTLQAGQSNVSLRSFNGGLREDLEYRANKRFTLRGGADFLINRTTFRAEVPIPADYVNAANGQATAFTDTTQPVEANQLYVDLGVYSDAIFSWGKLKLIPGVRFDLSRYEQNLRLDVMPRVTARYQLKPSTTLKAAAGMFSITPQPQFVNPQFGNPHLSLEHAAHFSVGVEQKLLPRLLPALSLDAQVYTLYRWGLVVPTSQIAIDGSSIRPLRYLNDGEGYSYGLEVLLKHDVTRRFYGWIAYTLSRSVAQRKAGGPFDLVVFDQTHIFTLVASLRLGVGWEIGTRFRLVSGRPDTSVLGGVLDSDRNRYAPMLGGSQDIRLPLFHQLDLRVEKTWFFKLWRFSAYLDVQNVYNAENPEAILRDYRYRQSGPLRGLPILPTIGLKGAF
jgi:TonB family protein